MGFTGSAAGRESEHPPGSWSGPWRKLSRISTAPQRVASPAPAADPGTGAGPLDEQAMTMVYAGDAESL